MDTKSQKKVKLKVGNLEFEGEGAFEDYKEQFDRFMQLAEKFGPQTASVCGAPATGVTAAFVGAATPPANDADPANPVPIGDDLLGRVFRRDKENVTLLALPRGDDIGPDAMVMLLYGYLRLLNRPSVTGVTLMKSAKLSGVRVSRVDTTMAKRQDYVLPAGVRRAKVYQLNNRGIAYAEQIVRRAVD